MSLSDRLPVVTAHHHRADHHYPGGRDCALPTWAGDYHYVRLVRTRRRRDRIPLPCAWLEPCGFIPKLMISYEQWRFYANKTIIE